MFSAFGDHVRVQVPRPAGSGCGSTWRCEAEPMRAIERAGRGVVGPLDRRSGPVSVSYPAGLQSTRADPSRSSSGAGGEGAADGPRGELAFADQHRAVLVAVLERAEPVRLARAGAARRAANANCWRSNGGFSGAIGRRWRADPAAVVAQEERRRARAASSVPERVTTLIAEAAERPALRRELVGRDLELLHRFLRHVLQRTTHHVVVVVGAVDRDHAAAPELTRRATRVTLLVLVGSKFGLGIARDEQRELQEVAAVQGQRLDGVGADHAIDGRRARRRARAPRRWCRWSRRRLRGRDARRGCGSGRSRARSRRGSGSRSPGRSTTSE